MPRSLNLNRSTMHSYLRLKYCLGALLLGTLFATSGCVPQELTDRTKYSVNEGLLANEDMRIVAQDGSFEIEGGEGFRIPFDIDMWEEATGFEPSDLVDSHEDALARGAKRVRVYVDGLDEPLHGVLAFNKMIRAAHGPGARSYRVQIPQERIASATQGNTTVTFEAVDYRREFRGADPEDLWWYGWVLWLADTPL